MIVALVLAAAVASSPDAAPAAPSLSEAAHAIQAGRLDQARIMIGKAVAGGATGQEVDRLVADLDYASGKNEEALARYQQLLAANASDSDAISERAGIAALKLGRIDDALALLIRATKSPDASWRAWNARGVIADLRADWPTADEAYGHAATLAPDRPELANNRGWSQLIRGKWAAAIPHLERAVALGANSIRSANNLELARAALSEGLPQRRPLESAHEWAKRLNDAGVAAELSGDRIKAVAAFAQALQASETWYARAANNLASVTASK
jgi:Flp pilus assembly protein TadD